MKTIEDLDRLVVVVVVVVVVIVVAVAVIIVVDASVGRSSQYFLQQLLDC